jgi:general secretion pathway protein G
MTTRQSHRHGFSLVELILVITILGILAALVAPGFSNASDEARATNALSQLTSGRKQLEVWKLDHGDRYPTLVQMQSGPNDWGVFTSRTSSDGVIDAAGPFGPYFPTPPVNPWTNSSLVVAANSPLITAGWTYNESTGELRLVLPANADVSNSELTGNDYERAP